MPKRLTIPHIERKPKDVHVLASFDDPAGLARDPGIAKVLIHIRKCIENGSPLPTNYYRKGSSATYDTLLETHGIMHLHLGRPNTAELLYAVQYDDHVVFLELNDHRHLQTKPKGACLVSRHGLSILSKEAELDRLPTKVTPKRGPVASTATPVKPPRRPTSKR